MLIHVDGSPYYLNDWGDHNAGAGYAYSGKYYREQLTIGSRAVISIGAGLLQDIREGETLRSFPSDLQAKET